MAQEPEGVGIGFRRSIAEATLATEREVGWLEITPENFMGKAGPFSAALEQAKERFALAAHGVALNVGGPTPFDEEHLRLLKRLLDELGIPRFTEHLCWTNAHGYYSHDLLPLPLTEEAVKHAAGRARELMDRLERPLLLENVSTYAIMPGPEMTEPEFMTAVLEESGAGMLLDVNNVYVCAHNHGKDPLTELLAYPLDKTGQMHLAGHIEREDMLVDTHSRPVRDEVWALYEEAARRVPKVATLIEWDQDIPDLDAVLDEADKARAIWSRARAGAAAGEENPGAAA